VRIKGFFKEKRFCSDFFLLAGRRGKIGGWEKAKGEDQECSGGVHRAGGLRAEARVRCV